MNILILIISAFVSLTPPDWLKDLEQAKTRAREENKTILLNFSGSDWCGPCIKLKKEVFNAEPFANYASQNLVLVNADFPRLKKNQPDSNQMAKNEKLAEQYNPKGMFPLTVLLDADGKVLKQWEGVPVTDGQAFVLLLQKCKK